MRESTTYYQDRKIEHPSNSIGWKRRAARVLREKYLHNLNLNKRLLGCVKLSRVIG